jgi:hypothetical protein
VLFRHLQVQGPAAPIGPLRVEGDTCGRVLLTVHVRRDGVLGSGMFRLDLAASREATAQRSCVGASAARCGIMIRMAGSCCQWGLAGAWRWPQSGGGRRRSKHAIGAPRHCPGPGPGRPHPRQAPWRPCGEYCQGQCQLSGRAHVLERSSGWKPGWTWAPRMGSPPIWPWAKVTNQSPLQRRRFKAGARHHRAGHRPPEAGRGIHDPGHR